jgi:hypothetical protein
MNTTWILTLTLTLTTAPQSQSIALHMKALMKTSLAELDFRQAMTITSDSSMNERKEQIRILGQAHWALDEALNLFGQGIYSLITLNYVVFLYFIN